MLVIYSYPFLLLQSNNNIIIEGSLRLMNDTCPLVWFFSPKNSKQNPLNQSKKIQIVKINKEIKFTN